MGFGLLSVCSFLKFIFYLVFECECHFRSGKLIRRFKLSYCFFLFYDVVGFLFVCEVCEIYFYWIFLVQVTIVINKDIDGYVITFFSTNQ